MWLSGGKGGVNTRTEKERNQLERCSAPDRSIVNIECLGELQQFTRELVCRVDEQNLNTTAQNDHSN